VSDLGIMRLEPGGPSAKGLSSRDPIDSARLVSGSPERRGHAYHERPDLGYLAGVWSCTAMASRAEPQPANEFVFVFEGSLAIAQPGRGDVEVRAGEGLVVPQGLRCSWKLPGRVRACFARFEDRSGRARKDPAALGAIRLEPTGPAAGLSPVAIANPEIYLGGVPRQRDHGYFEDATHQMFAGLWESTAFERASAPFPRNEIMCILEGSVTLTGADGVGRRFAAGDVAYVPMGALCAWKSSETVRKFYAIFQPVD
jgi:uncharacterized cupin superfamily protein